MANWKEDMISRIQEEKLEKEIKDMAVDFTKDREKINQEFDDLCKEIIEQDYDSSIQILEIIGAGGCTRSFAALGIEYRLYIKKNEIMIAAFYNENTQDMVKQTYLIEGSVGEDKSVKCFNGKGVMQLERKLNTTEFDYNLILDILMNNAYKEVNDEIKNLKTKKQREIHENKSLEDLLNSTDFRNQ